MPFSVPAPDAPPSATQCTYCLPHANHQHLVTAFHLAGGKYWSVGWDQGVRVGWSGRCKLCQAKRGVWTLMSSVTTSSATLDRRTAPADRRWLVLVVAAVAQLMLVLDATTASRAGSRCLCGI